MSEADYPSRQAGLSDSYPVLGLSRAESRQILDEGEIEQGKLEDELRVSPERLRERVYTPEYRVPK